MLSWWSVLVFLVEWKPLEFTWCFLLLLFISRDVSFKARPLRLSDTPQWHFSYRCEEGLIVVYLATWSRAADLQLITGGRFSIAPRFKRSASSARAIRIFSSGLAESPGAAVVWFLVALFQCFNGEAEMKGTDRHRLISAALKR